MIIASYIFLALGLPKFLLLVIFMVILFEIHKNFIFPSPKKNEPMKISAPYFLYNQEFWNIQFPWKNIG